MERSVENVVSFIYVINVVLFTFKYVWFKNIYTTIEKFWGLKDFFIFFYFDLH